MLLNLMGEAEKIPVAGKVIWMTPKGRAGEPHGGNWRPVQRPRMCGATQKKIENYLAGALGGDKPTHTM